MSTAPTATIIAADALDLLTATGEQLEILAATLRAIRRAYPSVFADMTDGIRSGLLDTRHLADLGLGAVSDWRDYLKERGFELTAQLSYAQEVAHA